jgi:hypothetical protein
MVCFLLLLAASRLMGDSCLNTVFCHSAETRDNSMLRALFGNYWQGTLVLEASTYRGCRQRFTLVA